MISLDNVLSGFTSKITSTFGKRDTSKLPKGATSNHLGVDVAVPLKTEIGAWSSGTVTKVAYSSAKGNFIHIDHGSGYVSEYEHLSTTAVKKGQSVAAGQTIALSGDTGISSGPHLHFGLMKNGKYIDPLTAKGVGSMNMTATTDKVTQLVKDNWLLILGGLLIFAVMSK